MDIDKKVRRIVNYLVSPNNDDSDRGSRGSRKKKKRAGENVTTI